MFVSLGPLAYLVVHGLISLVSSLPIGAAESVVMMSRYTLMSLWYLMMCHTENPVISFSGASPMVPNMMTV
jgi:hypothetical protein